MVTIHVTHHEHVMSTMPDAVELAQRLHGEIAKYHGDSRTLQMQENLHALTRVMVRLYDTHIRALYPVSMGDFPWLCSCGAEGAQ